MLILGLCRIEGATYTEVARLLKRSPIEIARYHAKIAEKGEIDESELLKNDFF